LRVQSWNVNGLRAAAKKGFAEWLSRSAGEIIGLQEVRARPEQIPAEIRSPDGWHVHVSAAQRPGYSGVALYGRRRPDAIVAELGIPEFDAEGRVQIATYGALTVVNAYFPTGNGATLPGGKRSNDRIPYKLDFYKALWERLEPSRARGDAILVLGDFNTAHTEIDLARPKQNVETSGFRPEERAELDRWIASGWTDTFRHFHPGAEGHYSWWAQRGGCRERNVGWRIDYVLASPGAMRHVEGAFIEAHTLGSDHCPVGVDVRPAIFGGHAR
jgi:exodeoxyribonuclease-3